MNASMASTANLKQRKQRHQALARRGPRDLRKIPQADQAEIQCDRAKHELLPASLEALRNARRHLIDLQTCISERQSSGGSYSIKQKATDSGALEKLQSRVATLEQECAHWSKCISDYENAETLRDYNSIIEEISQACSNGQTCAQQFFVSLKSLFKKFDSVCEQEALFQRATRQLSRCRTVLLQSGCDVPYLEQQIFPTEAARIQRFVASELSKRPRTSEDEWPKYFPYVTFSKPADDDEGEGLTDADIDELLGVTAAKPKAKRTRKAKARKTVKKPANVAKLQGKKTGRIRARAA